MKRNTANKILATATSLFAALGYENVTLRQLSQTANINRAAISYYFDGKENLYQEVLGRQFFPALQALQKADASRRLSATERLRDYAAVIAAVKRKQPDLTSFWRYEMNRHNAGQNSFIVREYTVQLYLSLLSALSHGICQNEFQPNLEPFSAASMLLEMLHAPYVPASLLTQQALSAKDIREAYAVQSIHHYLQGIRRVPL